jgi:exopolysaccharide biosynthesis polyprenyl glycosylphosphotransferase
VIRTGRGERALLLATDGAVLALAFVSAYALRFYLEVLEVTRTPPPSQLEYGRAFGIALLVFWIVFFSRRLYRDVQARGIDVVERVFGAVSVASLIVLAASFFDRSFSYSRTVFLLVWAQCLLVLPIPRLALLWLRRARYERGEGLVPVLIVGTSARARDLHTRLTRHQRYGLKVLGFVSCSQESAPAEGQGDSRVWGDLSELTHLVELSGAQEVLLAHDLQRIELFEALEACERIGVEVRIVPHTLDLFVTPTDLSELFGVPFVSLREDRFAALSLVAKRVFDLVVGFALFLLTLPLVVFLCALIRSQGEGSPLFRQRRVGQGGRVFGMWKLRSMVPNAEARLGELVDLDQLEAPTFKLEHDPRVTGLGRLLRRWSLDELPQFWNVVVGDMSLVGPRPEVEAVVARYDAHHRRRLKAKPGITGLQQIEARASSDMEERICLDVYYTRRRSLIFDLWILARTPLAVARGSGAH